MGRSQSSLENIRCVCDPYCSPQQAHTIRDTKRAAAFSMKSPEASGQDRRDKVSEEERSFNKDIVLIQY